MATLCHTRTHFLECGGGLNDALRASFILRDQEFSSSLSYTTVKGQVSNIYLENQTKSNVQKSGGGKTGPTKISVAANKQERHIEGERERMVSCGDGHVGLQSVGESQQQWLWSPIERRCLSLIQHSKTRSRLLQIHAFMLRNALETNRNLFTKFITTCSSVALLAPDPLAGIAHARRVFDHRRHGDDAFLCNSMIKAHVDMHQFSDSFLLYRDLRRNTTLTPNSFTFSLLARSCSLNMAIWEGQEIHSQVVAAGTGLDLYVATALVDMYAKFGKLDCARNLFDEMIERSPVSWSALIGGYVRSGDIENAGKLFDQMPVKDSVAFNTMMDAYVKFGNMCSARKLFDEMPDRTVVSWTIMISSYCNNGNLGHARSLFDVMPERNLFSWNAMIRGYCQNKQPYEALKLFHEMQSTTSLEPDRVTVVSVLPAIADLGALDLGGWVHRFVRRKKLDKETNVATTLIDMYAKCGEIVKATRVFDDMPKKETASWNALIKGLAINGLAKEALETFMEMNRNGFKPNDITMIAVLSACSHSGLVEEGRKWFQAMEEFGLTPKIEHYGCMVDLLGRAGCLEEAERLIESMPYEANGIILSSFLFACGYSKDVVRAERVLKMAIKMEAGNDGNYIMLRNLYAYERRWKEADEVKGLMRRNGAKKEAGCSAIEVDSRVWEFVSGDTVHPQWEAIRSVLAHLWAHMKRRGCTLQSERETQVCPIGVKEKSKSQQYH